MALARKVRSSSSSCPTALRQTRICTYDALRCSQRVHRRMLASNVPGGNMPARTRHWASRRVPLSRFGVVRCDMDLQLVRELRNSIKDCSERGLVVAGKWYITAFHRTNITLKVHHESGLPSFTSRYHNTNETCLLLIQEPDFPPQHPHARAHLALRFHLPPYHL
jgi:hypothetical protein